MQHTTPYSTSKSNPVTIGPTILVPHRHLLLTVRATVQSFIMMRLGSIHGTGKFTVHHCTLEAKPRSCKSSVRAAVTPCADAGVPCHSSEWLDRVGSWNLHQYFFFLPPGIVRKRSGSTAVAMCMSLWTSVDDSWWSWCCVRPTRLF